MRAKRDPQAVGLVVIISSYPSVSFISKAGETAINVWGYAAHLGVHRRAA